MKIKNIATRRIYEVSKAKFTAMPKKTQSLFEVVSTDDEENVLKVQASTATEKQEGEKKTKKTKKHKQDAKES